MSKKECINDCTIPLRFPRRPGTGPFTENGDDCPCCGSLAGRISQDNRPALPRFNYRIGTYGSIREFLFNRIDMTPELRNWTHRAPDDPAVALLEGASILGDILTFYQETYANEAYLRTALWRESIADLVRLLGYRLSPAVGGNAVFAFELKKDEPVVIPAGFPLKATLEELPKPAEFETLKEIKAYPWLSRFNLYCPLVAPSDIGNITEFYIPAPNQLLAPIDLKVGDRLIVGKTNATDLNQPTSLENAEIAIVDSIEELHGVKTYKVKGSLKLTSDEKLVGYRLGRTFHHFGYNSSVEILDTSAEITSTATVNGNKTTTESTIPTLNVSMSRPVDTSSNSFTGIGVSRPLSDREFPIELEIDDLPVNVPVVIQASYWEPPASLISALQWQPTQSNGGIEQIKVLTNQMKQGPGQTMQGSLLSPMEKTLSIKEQIKALLGQYNLIQITVRTIADIRTVTMTWGSISGTVSQLTLNSELGSSVGADSWMKMAETQFHEVTSPLFEIRRAKIETAAATGDTLMFYGTEDQVKNLDDRRIMLEKADEEPRVVSVTNVPLSADAILDEFSILRPVTLSEEVIYAGFPNEKPVTTVFGNVVDADEGKTLPETPIGSGDATLAFQNFQLPKAPLTYHIVPENTPSETSELEIYVDGRQWTQVDSFFGCGKDEQVYIVREDANGNSWVQFGDGKTGARLTSGVKNVTAVYRIGDGAFGPLKADTKAQASAKLKNLDKIGMPSDVTGGALPEDGENARNAAPGKVQSLGRIVSLKDFEAEAAAIPGVAAASVAWQLVDNVPLVVVTVLMETGRSTEIAAVRNTLNSYNTQRGAGRHAIDVVPGKRIYVAVSLEYVLKPTYRTDLVEPVIRRALGANYGNAPREEDQSGLFSLRRRRFGVREYASSIEGTVQNVEGVLWARTVAFTGLSDSDDPKTIALPATTVLDPIVSCDGRHILSLYAKHLVLSAVKEEGS